MREVPRKRRQVPPAVLALSRPAFRFSSTRQAYVLRGVGERVGPVLVPRASQPAPPAGRTSSTRLEDHIPWEKKEP